jgi:prohibitin 2
MKILPVVLGTMIIIITIVLLAGVIEIIPAGHKGIVINSPDGPSTTEINEGWQTSFKYLVSDIIQVEWRTQSISFVGSDEEADNVGSIMVSSQDNVPVYMDFTIIYHIQEDKVADLIISTGTDYQHRVIMPTARSVPRDVAAHYLAMEIRGVARDRVERAIRENITLELASRWIIVEDFALRDIRLPEDLERAIETKKVAEQNILTQEYNLQAAAFIANKTVVTANANALALIINASAQANATIIQAGGQSEAIRIIMSKLNSTTDNATRDYLQWVYLQALTSPGSNVRYIIIPSDGGVPILLDVKD